MNMRPLFCDEPLESLFARKLKSQAPGGADSRAIGAADMLLGRFGERRLRAFLGNLNRAARQQSVIKRIRRGGCRSKAELKRQMAYITQDGKMPEHLERQLGEGESVWGNIEGFGAEPLNGFDLEEVQDRWAGCWRGSPKLGHTDHLILSFPPGVHPERIKAISEEWGERIFGSGDFGDRWDYVASMHADQAHGHVHFIVNKRGIDDGKWLSISRHADLNYDLMREIHAEIAGEYGVTLHASSRFSRGITEARPDPADFQQAQREGREPIKELQNHEEIALVAARFAESYGALAELCDSTSKTTHHLRDELIATAEALRDASRALQKGEPVMTIKSEPLSEEGIKELQALQQSIVEKIERSAKNLAAMPEDAEKIRLQERFSLMVQESVGFAEASEIAGPYAAKPEKDHYHSEQMSELRAASREAPSSSPAAQVFDEARDILKSELVERFEQIEGPKLNPETLFNRLSLGASPSEGTLRDWDRADRAALTAQHQTAGLEIKPELIEAKARGQVELARDVIDQNINTLRLDADHNLKSYLEEFRQSREQNPPGHDTPQAETKPRPHSRERQRERDRNDDREL